MTETSEKRVYMKQDLINNLQKDICILFEKHSNEIAKDNIGQAFNIMKDIDAALNQLKTLTNIEGVFEYVKEPEINGWYKVLKYFIETQNSHN